MIKLLCTLLLVTATSTAIAAPKKKTAPKKNGTAVAQAKNTASGLTIKSIEVSGNRKIEKDAILSKITTKVGDEYKAESVRADVQALFGLGYFNNIEVNRQVSGKEAVLTYQVLEKPSIAEITYEGNTEIKSEDIADATGIKAYQLLNMSKVKEAIEKVQKLYEDKGFFLARVEAEVQDVTKDETVRLVFKIRENDKVKVRKITFLGAKHISETELKSKMFTQEGGFFSGMSGSGQYKQEAFDRDAQIVRFMYFNQGYVQAKIDRPQITVTPDKKNIYITFNVEEGEQYSVGDVDFAGDILFPKEELYEAIKIDENGVFSFEVLQKDISELTAKYGDLGYAFANVIPRTRANDKERKMDLVFEFDKGQKVYFGKINVVGNSKTRDKVVRRELKVREGELYNETRRRQSMEGIQRLGFFEDVNFKTSVDPEKTDVMNVDIIVKERNTGQIQLGAGYGTSQGFTLQGSVQQTNFLGKGQNLGASLNLSGTGSFYNLSFTEPYFNDTEWLLGGDVYQSMNTGRMDYDENHTGASVRMGRPIAEFTRGFLRAKYDKSDLKERRNADGTLITDTDLFPLDSASGETISLTGTLEYDTRNDRFSPTKGMFASASYEYAGFGQLKYNRASTKFNFFRNLFWDVTWRNNLQYARIDGLDGQEVPFNELYLLGGPYSLRGFRSYRVGKMKFSQKIYNESIADGMTAQQANIEAMRFYGGTQQALFQTELQFPLVKDAGIFGAAFFDIGSADDVLNSDTLFSDMGLGIRWYSPIGVLRFEWGFPLNRDPNYHDASVFEFSIGPSF
ncbi:outer membrane protein assembly factor BamA [Bdellovibrio sp. HCB290]|uniref:outer membrane protein assembly factor BamA n=1 Tax=Bdellovibrio sp. HCB290 TaxID=3394356 RepID=UPI0039B46AB7